MAYKPGSQIRQFFKTGGFSLTDKSKNYGPGKIPLFKSLANLSPRERLYAIGYNFNTLGQFGLNFGQLVSIPYLIGEYSNTARSVVKNLKSPSQVLGGDILKRQKLLGGARAIGGMKGTLQRAVRTGTPLDRASNILIGRESASFLQNVRNVGTSGVAMNVVQSVNAKKMDKTIQAQAQIPTKNNVFLKWRSLTFVEAFKNAPDPFRDNPIRKAEKIRHKTVKTKGQEFDITKEKFHESLLTGMDTQRAQKFMNIIDMDNFAGGMGHQKELVANVLNDESIEFFGPDSKQARLTRKSRIEMYEQSYYDSIGGIMGSNSTQTRDYLPRETNFDFYHPKPQEGEVISGTGGNPGNVKRVKYMDGDQQKIALVQDVVLNPDSGMVTTHNSRAKQVELSGTFLRSFSNDFDGPSVQGYKNLSAFDMGPEVIPSLKSLARAFNHPFAGQSPQSMNGQQLVDVLAQIVTQINIGDIGTGFPLNTARQANEIVSFQKTLRKYNYNSLAKKLRKEAGFTMSGKDPQDFNLNQHGFLRGRNQVINTLAPSLNNGVLFGFTRAGSVLGNEQLDLTFQPNGHLMNHKYYNSLLKRQRAKKPQTSLMKIHTGNEDKMESRHHIGNGTNAQRRIVEKKKIGKTNLFHDVERFIDPPGHHYSYEDIIKGRLGGLEIKRDGGVLKTVRFKKHPHVKDGTYLGKDQAWWQKKIKAMDKEFNTHLVNLLGIDPVRIAPLIKNSENLGSLSRQIEKELVKNAVEVNNALETTGAGVNVKRGDPSYRGKSNNITGHHNFTPSRAKVRKSIHMHDIDRNGKNENDGTPFLFRYSVSFGGSSPQSKHADAIRDARQIEYGGLATDANGNQQKRSDGMFYLPSNLMGIAGTKAAAYLGIWDKGSNFKTSVDKNNLTATISGGGISPLDLSSGTFDQRQSVRKDLRGLSQKRRNAFQGKSRMNSLLRDVERVVAKGATNNSQFTEGDVARIAQSRALALFRRTGEFGTVSGGDIFSAMDDMDKANLGLTGDKMASNYEMRFTGLGTYQGRKRANIGEFRTGEFHDDIGHGGIHSYQQGDKNLSKMYTYKFTDLANPGSLEYGEMPVIPLLNTELIRLKNLYTSTGTGKVDWDALSEFTNMPAGVIKQSLSQMHQINAFPPISRPYRFDFDINPSDLADVRNIMESPHDELVAVFGLDKLNGPLRMLDGSPIPLNSPAHPGNQFKRIFHSGEMTNEVYSYVYNAYLTELDTLITHSNIATQQLIKENIKQYARTSAERFEKVLNATMLKHMGASAVASEYEFRQVLMRIQYAIRWSKLNATRHAKSIRNRFGRVGLVADDMVDEIFTKDGGLDLEMFNNAKTELTPDEGGYRILIRNENNEVVKVLDDKADFSQKELDMVEYFDPMQQAKRNFAENPNMGMVGQVGGNSNNIYSQAQVSEILEDLSGGDETMLELYKELYDVGFIQGIPSQGGGKILRKFTAGQPLSIDLNELAVISSKKRILAHEISTELIFKTMRATEARQDALKGVLVKAKLSTTKPGWIANEFWKNTRGGIDTPQLYREVVGIFRTRAQSARAMSDKKDLAGLVKALWYGSIPVSGNIKGKRVVRENPLTPGKAAIFDSYNELPAGFTKLQEVFSMLGFNFNNYVNTDSYANVPQLTDADFLEIAQLIMRVPDTSLMGNAPYVAPSVVYSNLIKKRKKPKK